MHIRDASLDHGAGLTPALPRPRLPTEKFPRAKSTLAAAAVAALVIAVIGSSATFLTPWPAATAIALTLFFAFKAATLHSLQHTGSRARVAAYLLLWPGMNAAAFLRTTPAESRPARSELGFAGLKLVFGLGLTGIAVAHASDWPATTCGAIGIVGVLFTIHFGFFHVLSWIWRDRGVIAPPLMRAPILARSVAEFWSFRWNTAFSDLARRFILRPAARRWGVGRAIWLVFVFSGVVHELAISVPARGGWGGPTLYFLLQAAGVAVEKSALGRALRLGTGIRGWSFTLLCTAAPAPLLFHRPMLEHVVVPLLRF